MRWGLLHLRSWVPAVLAALTAAPWLCRQAAAAGGALHVLNGNHESMNVAGQYRYVTRGAMHRCVAGG